VTKRIRATLDRQRQDIDDKYTKERDERAERDDALIELGVIKNRGDSVHDGTVAKIIFERQKAETTDADRIRDLTLTNEAQSARIAKLEDDIKDLMHKHYVPGFDKSFDANLAEKQRNYKRLVRDFEKQSTGEAVNDRERLIVDLSGQVDQLRRLPGELSQLKEELEKVKEEKTQKGVDDERRWNGE
jgi:hypothetical protein